MRRLPLADRWILWTLVPIWAVCQILHIDRQISPLPLAWMPVYLSAAQGSDRGPTVLSLWPDTEQDETAPRPGDELLAVGGAELRGASRLRVWMEAFPAATEGGIPFRVRRGDAFVDTTLRVQAVPVAWGHLPLSLALGVTAILVLFRGRGTRAARAYVLAALCYSLHFSSLYAGLPWQTAAGLWLVIASGAFYPPLMVRAALIFPEGVTRRGPTLRFAPWLLLLTGPALYVWIFGIERYALYGFQFTGALVTVGIAGLITALIVNYWRSPPRGRRQLKWAALGLFLGTAPSMAVSAVTAARPELRDWYEASLAFGVAVPVFFLVALVRDNLFDINRLITTTATYVLLVPALVGLLFQVVPAAAARASELTGLQATTTLWTLTLAVTLPVPFVARALRPQLERWFFRDQFRAEGTLRELRRRIGSFRKPAELLNALGAELGRELELERCAVYSRTPDAFVPVSTHGAAIAPGFEPDGALVALLGDAAHPIPEERWRRWCRQGLLGAGDHAALESLDPELLLPLLRGESLEGFLALGRKDSGELYSRAEIAMLENVAERISDALAAFDQAAIDAGERRLYESLKNYAPSSVVEQVERTGEIVEGEREVSVLFVDVRGYTAFSRGRQAPDIFEFVSSYTTAVSAVVRDEGGAVVEFHGDGLMAAFGATGDDQGKERRAVRAAVQIVREVERQGLRAPDGTRLSVGVGVATGPAFVGDIRSVDRKIWGVIGNTTNLAARLERLTRDLDAAAVIDDTTRSRAGDAADGFASKHEVRVKGRDDEITVWCLSFGDERWLGAGADGAERA